LTKGDYVLQSKGDYVQQSKGGKATSGWQSATGITSVVVCTYEDLKDGTLTGRNHIGTLIVTMQLWLANVS
jgi:hypothetical protein